MTFGKAHYKKLADVPREEYLSPGTPLCGGCGGLLTVRLAHKVLGPDVVFVNAAGCLTLMTLYPYSPLASSWLYTAMACAPAGAQGLRDALDILIERGRLRREQDLKVVVLTGDGAAYDIGLQATLAAIHRGLDFYYICYDNEGYGNTGFQASPATPYGSATGTTPPLGAAPEGNTLPKKKLFELWTVQSPPYAATVSPGYPLDLAEKFKRAEAFRGPKLFLAHAPCPTGWGHDPSLGFEVGKLAVDTGLWPLKEAVHGEVAHTHTPKLLPVEEYLRPQGRFRHLFEPRRQGDVIAGIQEEVDAYWHAAGLNPAAIRAKRLGSARRKVPAAAG